MPKNNGRGIWATASRLVRGRAISARRRQLVALCLLLAALVLWRGSGPTLRVPGQGMRASFNYPSSATAVLLPGLMRRKAQQELEQRWGMPQVLSPRPLPYGSPMRIPRILHHVNFPAIDDFLTKTADPASSTREQWALSCRRMHPDWQYMFWDWESAVQLVKTYYPAYLDMFEKLDSVIKKADAIRYFIMHAVGGLYLDLDVECFAPVEPWLSGFDVVLQNPGPTDGIMASAPGNPLWVEVMTEMRKRWWDEPGRNVVDATGPGLLSAVFKRVVGTHERPEQADPWAGEHTIWGTRAMVHAGGTYFHPCEWTDHECFTDMLVQRALGTANLTQLAGQHRFAASWWKEGENSEGKVTTREGLERVLCASAAVAAAAA